MATLAQTECTGEVLYPEKCRSVQARKKHKEKTLRDNPDLLYADYIQLNGRRIKNNLIFYTTLITAWKSAICEEFKNIFKEGIGRGGRLTICKDEMLDTDNPILTITYYTKGTFLLQGNEASLNSFEEIFPRLKARVEEERDEPHANSTDSEEEGPVILSPAPSDRRLRDSLALLELDFAEFREHTQVKLSDTCNTNSSIQALKDELRQLKKDTNSTITELNRALRELQGENQTLRVQMRKLEEDNERKEESFSRQLQVMREQLQKNTEDNTRHYSTAPTTDYTNTDSEPATNTQTPAETQPPPAPPPEPDPDILLLIDSNGKFLDPQKLFPHQKVSAKRCSTTGHAHQIIRDFPGQPSCVIIHTGTNDLHSLRNNTADAVRKMAETTSKKFPESRIVISTLLPRHDTPPHIIHNINTEISRRCSSLPNVHLVHHHHIGLHHLYDGLHLHRDAVRTFARALKDAALGRTPTPPRHLLPTPEHYRPIQPYMPRHTPPTPMRRDVSWTNIPHPPPRSHPPMDHYTPVNLQSPTPRSPAGHQVPIRKKKPTPSTHTEKSPHPRAQSYAEALARPPAPPTTSTSTPASELSQIREMLQTLCNQLLNR